MLRHIEGLLFLQASFQIGLVALFDKFRCFLTFVFTALKNPNGNQWIFVFVLLYKQNFENNEVGGRKLLNLMMKKVDGDPDDQGEVKKSSSVANSKK